MTIKILKESAIEWVRAHPAMFFDAGQATAQNLVEQLTNGARVLGATTVETITAGAWHVVAAREDWFPNARIPIPGDFKFSALVGFPEQGDNCVRPEFLIAAFASDVIVKAENSEPIVLGTVLPEDEIYEVLARNKTWCRVIAFRGVESRLYKPPAS
ncbi:hypothetical protein [Variovorax sp. IB41]|uniref:hypothetical protein n=1 Tax=Variovorax sp. IB41 TaxID=2779370 RepID=UPI0018E777A4|nr:hypothetical protein [Variovorax sp. IB41]MBJ2157315.1 hypothetical protein [Variovorax sp. IB41]